MRIGGKHLAWSDKDIRLAKRLRFRGVKEQDMLVHFPGRSRSAIQGLFRRLGVVEKRPRKIYNSQGVFVFAAPEKALADRERRLNEPRTLTQQFFGDPPPSQSALGRLCQ